MLIVTNGDGAVFALRQAGISHEALPWRDVLHDGPVPGDVPPKALPSVRAAFIADSGWVTRDDALAQLQHRDERLGAAHGRDEIVLWFEHDLYDQLQLLQVLDRLSNGPTPGPRLTLVCHEAFIAESQYDLLAEWFRSRAPVTDDQLALGARAWAAFRAPSPEAWAGLLDEDTSALPFLGAAVLRLLEEFPGVGDGLARSERQVLQLVRDGVTNRRAVFRECQALEEAKYLGDWSFDRYVAGLMRPPNPLLTAPSRSGSLALTRLGESVLDGRGDWVELSPPDKWLGGVHLRPDAVWRWTGSGVIRDKA